MGIFLPEIGLLSQNRLKHLFVKELVLCGISHLGFISNIETILNERRLHFVIAMPRTTHEKNLSEVSPVYT